MEFLEFFDSNTIFNIIAAIVGTIWAKFKTTERYAAAERAEYILAVRAVEAAVSEVWQVYVKEIKHASDDGKLTVEEALQARMMARRKAIEIGRTNGVNVVKALGDAYLPLWIKKVVDRFKVGGAVTPA